MWTDKLTFMSRQHHCDDTEGQDNKANLFICSVDLYIYRNIFDMFRFLCILTMLPNKKFTVTYIQIVYLVIISSSVVN